MVTSGQLEKVIDGGTMVVSGKILSLWGIKPIESENPYSFAARLYLETMLKHGKLTCSSAGTWPAPQNVVRCSIDNADIGDIVAMQGAILATLCRHLKVEAEWFNSARAANLAEPVFAGAGHDGPEVLLAFLRVMYQPMIGRLSAFLGRDLSAWLEWDGRRGYCRR